MRLRRRLPGWRETLFSLGFLITFLLTLEGLLRILPAALRLERPDFKRAGILYEFHRTTRYHPRWGWSFLPDVHAVWQEDWKGRERARIKTTFRTLPIPGYPEYGMRDDGLDPGAGLVIPVFGDSFTFGSTVELAETWPELIEKRRPGVDMLNLAGGGGLSKAVEQYRLLRDRLPAHDAVVYQMWLGNEFLDNYAFPLGVRRFEELDRRHRWETRRLRLKAASRLAYVLHELYRNLRPQHDPIDALFAYASERQQHWDDRYGNFYLYPTNPMLLRYAEPEYEDQRIQTGIENTEDALLEMKALAGERTLAVLLFPFKEQLHDEIVMRHRPELDLAKPNRIVLEMCGRAGVTCGDLLEPLARHKTSKLFWDYDPHFNKTGQLHASLAAEEILEREGVLPPLPPLDGSASPTAPDGAPTRRGL